MVDPLVRQTALETLLERKTELTLEQLEETLKLGLTDPDFNIAEIAWKFIDDYNLVKDYKKELITYTLRLEKEGDDYSRKLANQILAAIEKISVMKV